ncbi:peptidoglycan/xylan/chitin deacetylase (PgdA/CDA1 family) [Kitasatospora gansuensis]|uniref:Peptidoglycan/xylan/chitin deacetylase (PgdA/CDA1 family) n=1 Tax=Kitasatospora gansuensis TaxID=258050 RepID=A0A7W7WJV2_9ACTN|nr:polysaccharide deacetylase family protein [Kitasatospora gansuensis]MBB4950217.1 peptidoglycan/xylan/chitin deacetylase (PgdA/CDA1 family) [Kitasatospora gansuensis]
MSLTRRTVLAGLAAGVLSSCAADPGPSEAPVASPSVSSSASSVRPRSVGSRGRDEVVAEYGAAVPTEWGLDVTGVVRSLPGGQGVALTFDACGGPGGSGYDRELVDALRRHAVPATLFVNSRWIEANPAVLRELAADPLFELGNHGTAHRPLSVTGRSAYGIDGTRDAGGVYDEVMVNHTALAALLGQPPRFFRSGTAHYDEVATRIVAELGERVAGFTVNADGGATFTAAQVRRALGEVQPGDVVIAHFNQPGHGTAAGFAAALPGLLDQGRKFVHLPKSG